MHPPTALDNMGRGFHAPAHDSQSVFRSVMDALAQPGCMHQLPVAAGTPDCSGFDVPTAADAFAAAALLALLDPDTLLWVSPRLVQAQAAQWLRFHTGCALTESASDADFVWAASANELPVLASLRWGTDAYPELSATCVVQVASLQPQGSCVLTGPGIRSTRSVTVDGLSADFWQQRQAMCSEFPRGLDFLFTQGNQLMGLPRTTQVRT